MQIAGGTRFQTPTMATADPRYSYSYSYSYPLNRQDLTRHEPESS